jgi:predicted nucleic acid-binding protein
VVKALFDTNIVIDCLNRYPQGLAELQRYPTRAISIVTWIETMVGADATAHARTEAFLLNFAVIQLDNAVARHAVALRRTYRIRLPDAIIWASAQIHGMLLITRNTKDFPADDPSVRAPYQL